jgi:acetyltransferase
MSILGLDRIFRPRGIALIGASEKPGTIGRTLVENLLRGEASYGVFPVNPRRNRVLDRPAYTSIQAIDQPVDLAVIATPIHTVPGVVHECATAGVGGAIVISAGGKEIGPAGKRIEGEISAAAARSGLRIIGPNCMGIICADPPLNASFAVTQPLPGNLAFISQSGAICSAILDLSLKEGIGFRNFVSIGSMLDVDFGDLVDYLGNDPQVSSIVLYVENLTNIRKFMSAARAVSRVKPIVVLKSGRSQAGARAASSHTGAMAGEDAAYEAAFKRAGIVRVDTIGELFDCAELMAKQPIPTGSGLAIVTNGGGPGVMATDALAAYGLEPVSLSSETLERLDYVLPDFWSRANPVDILGDATPTRWKTALEVCLSAREIHALVIIFVPQGLSDGLAIAQSLAELLKDRAHPPVFAVWMGGSGQDEARHVLNGASIPTYETPERAVTAFRYMHAYARNLEMLQEIPPKLDSVLQLDEPRATTIVEEALSRKEAQLTEVDAKSLLEAYGIPVNRTEVAASADEAVRIARQIGYPVVVKILSPQITHKSDARGVQINLRSDDVVRAAYERITENARAYDPEADILGVTVQAMLRRADYELIIGSKRDPDFGPLILFGMGGIMTEVLRDRAIALPPLNRLLARRLMEETRVSILLKGYRNRPPANLPLLEEMLIRLSHLVTDIPEIVELDINPVILSEDQAFGVDARVRIEPSAVPSPHHLVISPYPNKYESRATTTGGIPVFIRPIKPEDAPLLEELFQTLSRESVYYRFFSPIKKLPVKLIARFTQIDYDRDIALVALDDRETKEKMLGVARLMGDPDGRTAELAVTVGDPWQGKGVGAALMVGLLGVARERGMEKLFGIVLSENRQMIALARKTGFRVAFDRGNGQYRIDLDLRKAADPG